MKQYFEKPKKSDLIVLKSFNNEKTFKDICTKYIPISEEQTFDLAETLIMNGQYSVKSIFQFCRENIKYRVDDDFTEQIRLPRQTWNDRKKGVDCEDFVIFCSSILHNMVLDHSIKMVDYGNGWQHIYIVVPTGKKYIVLDPTLSVFNKEFPIKRAKEYSFKLK